MKNKILLIEDDSIMRITVQDALNAQGLETFVCDNGQKGIDAYERDRYSLVITDVRLPDMLGLDVMKVVKKHDEQVPVIVMTAYGTIRDAVEAIKLGAYDYVTKPFSLDEFILVVKRALEVRDLKEENVRLRRDLSDCYSFPSIIGESEEMRAVFDMVERISKTDSTVLITGESGTGKELIASAIHYHSARRNGPLVKVNCAALPENLVESELFGYEKGAFTGAARTKPGRFERADKGSIFLDEVGDLPQSVQTKLLRVLEDGEIERLGGTKPIRTDVRIIAATNRDILQDVSEGEFRDDLFYRLNVIPVHMPSLKERSADIPLLIEHFVGIYNCRFGKRVKMQLDAVAALTDYDYPGNVRELENIIERCIALASHDSISAQELPSHVLSKNESRTFITSLSDVAAEAERTHILKVLQIASGNRTNAAEMLGISRKCLWEKMKAYDI